MNEEQKGAPMHIFHGNSCNIEVHGEILGQDMGTVRFESNEWHRDNNCIATTQYMGPNNKGYIRNPGSVHAVLVSWEKDGCDTSDSHGVRLGNVTILIQVVHVCQSDLST